MPVRASVLLPVSSVAFAAAFLASASLARAGEPVPSFEGRGQVVLSDLLGLRTGGLGYLGVMSPSLASPGMSGILGYVHQESTGSQPSYTIRSVSDTYSVSPSIDVFAGKRVTLGVSLGFGKTDQTDTYFDQDMKTVGTNEVTSYLFGVAPRVGYVIPLGHGFSLWPRLGGGFTATRYTSQPVAPSPGSATYMISQRWTGGADVGVVYRPTEHLYFSAAPELSISFSRFQQQQQDYAIYDASSVNVRVAGSLSMGVIL